ncbi:MAG TPA: AAA family ATPase [Quisquiliibacterium sp.]|nr:AAA family ATPase [Quisquiliibacterium sp.]
MRIAQLHLAAFGAFTGRRLDFDAGGDALHLVFGPNEAGKSTTLRALSGFLFGIPARSDDAFLHPYESMRVGATLVLADGARLSAMRRKGNRNTLIGLDPATGAEQSDRVVSEDTLLRALGGLDEALYRQMYALDLRSLEEGSSALLRGEGELGQSLFQAAAGVAELQDLLRRLDEEAEALFSPRGQKPPLNAALRELAEQRAALRQAGVRPDAWESAERRLRESEAALAEARTQVLDARTALAAAQALARNLPLLAEHRARTARLSELDAVPVLPVDAAARRVEAQTLASAAGEAAEAARGRRDAIAAERAQLRRSPALLEHGQAIEAAFHRAAQWRDARDRLPGLEAARAAAVAALRAMLAGIAPPDAGRRGPGARVCGGDGDPAPAGASDAGPRAAGANAADPQADDRQADDRQAVDPDATHVRALLPAATLRARIDAQIEARARLDAQDADARRRADELDDEIAQAHAVLDAQAPAFDPVPLRAALSGLEGLADLERRLEQGRRARALAQAELERAAVGLAGVDVETLAAMHVPHAALVDEHRAAFEAIDRQVRDAERACETLRADLAARRAELRVLQATGEVVRRADVVEARARRDAEWGDLERAWQAAAASASSQAYVASVREADRLADLLHADAQRAALSEELSVRIADMASALEREDAVRAALEAQRTRRLADWNAAAAPLRAPGVMPEAARAWLDERTRLLDRADAARRDAAELEALQAALARADRTLAGALAEAGLPPRRPDESRAASAARLREAVDAAADARARVEEARQRLARDERTRARLRAEHQALTEARAAWHAVWRDVMRAVGLDGEATVLEARARLQEFQRLERALETFERVDGDLADARRAVDAFESGVHALAAVLDPSAGGLDAGAQAARLYDALQAARSAETRHAELLAEQARLAQTTSDAGTRQASAAHALQALLDAAHTDDVETLMRVEAANEERRALTARITAIEDDLVRLNACDFARVRAGAEGRDPASVDEEIARLALVLPALERRAEEALEAQIAARRAYEAIDGGDAAAGAAQALQQTGARIVEHARRYARARLARAVLGDVIQHYREQHQGPILGRASALFARMTVGAFEGLSAEFNDAGQVIMGVRAGGVRVPVSGMSRGTVDQLYLALRLAAIAETVRAQEPLPLLIDDLLVHFDDARSAATLQVLAELARDTQVVFFTHHEHLVALAAQVLAPDRYVVHRLPPVAHPSGVPS